MRRWRERKMEEKKGVEEMEAVEEWFQQPARADNMCFLLSSGGVGDMLSYKNAPLSLSLTG